MPLNTKHLTLADILRELTITRANREARWPHLMAAPDEGHRHICNQIEELKAKIEQQRQDAGVRAWLMNKEAA